jgi:hypothetical protein
LGGFAKKKDSVLKELSYFKGKNDRPDHCVAVRDEKRQPTPGPRLTFWVRKESPPPDHGTDHTEHPWLD